MSDTFLTYHTAEFISCGGRGTCKYAPKGELVGKVEMTGVLGNLSCRVTVDEIGQILRYSLNLKKRDLGRAKEKMSNLQHAT